MIEQIPQKRALLYLILLGLLPIFFVLYLIVNGGGELNKIEEKIDFIEGLALSNRKKQAQNVQVRQHHQNAEHFYLNQQLETLQFLEPEIQILQSALSKNNFPGSEAIKQRLDFLTSKENALSFTEASVERFPSFSETIEVLQHPVEVNVEDLRKILTLVEGVPIVPLTVPEGRPQLIVLDFQLNKKKQTNKNEVFTLNMKLLKREFN